MCFVVIPLTLPLVCSNVSVISVISSKFGKNKKSPYTIRVEKDSVVGYLSQPENEYASVFNISVVQGNITTLPGPVVEKCGG